MAGLIQVVKKIRRFIKSTRINSTIIFIDYKSLYNILKQLDITTTTSLIRIDTKLAITSQFLLRFNLNIRYISSKDNTIPDALLRLTSINRPLEVGDGELELLTNNINIREPIEVYIYSILVVTLNNDFRKRLAQGYTKDSKQSKVIK